MDVNSEDQGYQGYQAMAEQSVASFQREAHLVVMSDATRLRSHSAFRHDAAMSPHLVFLPTFVVKS